MRINPRVTAIGLAAAGFTTGAVLVGSAVAQAATSTPSPTPATGAAGRPTGADSHPGDNGADGVPEGQERHGGLGGPLSLTGTVTAMGTNRVTIRTASGTTVYSVTSTSDIDKNGEATLGSLAVEDAVRFSVEASNAKVIDKLHAGNGAKDMPKGGVPSWSSPGLAASTGA